MQKKDMNFKQAFNKYGLPLLGDADKDRVLNVLDCKPFDKNRDGLFGRSLYILSGGRVGQTHEEYAKEKIDKAKNLERLREKRIEFLKERNKVIDQQLKIQKLMHEQQRLLYLQNLMKPARPVNSTRVLLNNIFGFPMDPMRPAADVGFGRPGYELVYEPRLPRGYKWRKIPRGRLK